jgi:flagellar basal-body rod protein FlgG
MSLAISATGMNAQQNIVDARSNNVANMNSTAFKAGMVFTSELPYQTKSFAGAVSSDAGTVAAIPAMFGLGTVVKSVQKSFSQGSLVTTPGARLNLALDGPGFFQVTLADGTIAYTRDGEFSTSPTGEIVTADGFVVNPGIIIPDNAIDLTITKDGQVQVLVDDQPQILGRIELVNFISPGALRPIGGNLYLPSDASGDPVAGFPATTGFASVNQDFLEQSNVDAIQEMVELIKAQRAFEYNAKTMKTAEEILRDGVNAKA